MMSWGAAQENGDTALTRGESVDRAGVLKETGGETELKNGNGEQMKHDRHKPTQIRAVRRI